MRKRLKLRRNGASAWLLYDEATGSDIGGIDYVHAADGNHYRPWLLVDGVRSFLEQSQPQLAMAVRVVEDART